MEAKTVFIIAIKVSTKFLRINGNEQAREYFKTLLKYVRMV